MLRPNMPKHVNVVMSALAIATAVMLVAVSVTPVADAARPKLTKGDGNVQGTSTSCIIEDDFDLNCVGEVSGLGGSPVANLIAVVSAEFDCFNPSGQGPNPGHSGPETVTSPSQVLDVVNGKATFDLTIPAPSGPDEPNPQWDCNITEITFEDVTLVLDTVSGVFEIELGDF